MLWGGLEFKGLSNFRYTLTGTRELVCCPATEVMSLAQTMAEQDGRPPLEVNDKQTLGDILESTM
eukprot:9660307-Alexandrium_andersonii.AAC.1